MLRDAVINFKFIDPGKYLVLPVRADANMYLKDFVKDNFVNDHLITEIKCHLKDLPY